MIKSMAVTNIKESEDKKKKKSRSFSPFEESEDAGCCSSPAHAVGAMQLLAAFVSCLHFSIAKDKYLEQN